MNCQKSWGKLLPSYANGPLPVEVRRSKKSLLKLLNMYQRKRVWCGLERNDLIWAWYDHAWPQFKAAIRLALRKKETKAGGGLLVWQTRKKNRTESFFKIPWKKIRCYRAFHYSTSSHVSLFTPHLHCEHIFLIHGFFFSCLKSTNLNYTRLLNKNFEPRSLFHKN